ncbi:MAG: hypothetical protein ABW360_19445 [Phenylobacterium sp.]
MRFVLLHSPLLGPSSWRATAAALARLGHAVETPAWPRLSEVGGDYYPDLVDGLTIEAGEPPVLVAHSGAGALVPAVMANLATQARGAIFADALLPHPGLSWFDTAPVELRAQLRAGAVAGMLPSWDGWWPPGALERLVPDEATRTALVDELEPLPVGYFEAPAPDDPLEGRSAYLQLSGAYDDEARLAGRQGWPVVRLPLNHLAIVTQPQAVAGALDGLGAQLGR